MPQETLDEITKVLSEFALKKFSIKALEVRGPVQEGSRYRWRIISTRYKEVTVLLKTKKPLFSKSTMSAIEVYGFKEQKLLQPTVEGLRDSLERAELVPAN
jgi:hypothetical protein